jgi:methyltransferase (TIGR00027 family)
MSEVLIKDGFDTASLVAYYRAVESERPGALIHDPYARHLAGERGEELMRIYPRAKEEVWAVAVRTRIYDEILLHRIKQEQVDTVINLAAGLDARPYRLDLPSSLRWIEVDLSLLLQYKEERLANKRPVCALERIPLDITDHEARTALLAEVCQQAKQVLVLTEGLLIYLTAEQVVAIARDLNEQAPIGWWLTEFVAPSALKRDEKTWNKIATEKNWERFSPVNGTAFFQEYGWNVAEFHSVIEAALRFNAPIRFRWLLRLLMRLTPKQPGAGPVQTGFVLLERASSQA